MRRKLTDRMLATAKAPVSGRTEFWDASLPGFGVRVTSNGRKSFVLMYRMEGRKRRLTLGNYPGLSLAKAREKAGAALSRVDLGIDPSDEKLARRRAGTNTFGDSLDDYFQSPAVRINRSASETKRLIERDCRPWLNRPMRSITRRDAQDLLDGIVERGSPIMANRMHAYLSAFFSWAAQRDLIDDSPLANVARPASETPRDRVLSDGELAEVWIAASHLGYPFGPLVQLLVLTAQRRGEVGAMAWTDLMLDAVAPEWRMPREITKTDRAHDVPLSKQAIAILDEVPGLLGPLVFSTRNGDLPLAGWSKFKAKLDQIIHDLRTEAAREAGDDVTKVKGMPHWTLHDLRRTAATGMARLGVPPHVVERILNHSGGAIRGVAAIYNRFDYAAEKRDALQRWADHIEAIVYGGNGTAPGRGIKPSERMQQTPSR